MAITCSALWVGTEVGPVHAACLRSFGAVGLPITLYVYDRPTDVPANVELADAAAIVPKEQVFRHRATGSFSIFADMFRYVLLRKVSTLYVDVDLYCLRPIPDADYIFGWEDATAINNAVLKYPSDSPLAKRLFRVGTKDIRLFPWHNRKATLKAIYRHLVGGGPTASYLDWGVIGPRAITHYVKTLGLSDRASSSEVFYPVHWRDVKRFLEPNTRLRELVGPSTLAVHLYSEAVKRTGIAEFPPTSPMMEMLEGRVEL